MNVISLFICKFDKGLGRNWKNCELDITFHVNYLKLSTRTSKKQ